MHSNYVEIVYTHYLCTLGHQMKFVLPIGLHLIYNLNNANLNLHNNNTYDRRAMLEIQSVCLLLNFLKIFTLNVLNNV